MDSGEGRFVKMASLDEVPKMREKYPKTQGVFTVREIIEIRGSRFRVESIGNKFVKLKLLKPEARK